MNLAKIPFSYHWIMRRCIGEAKSILDIGCGDGDFTADLVKGKNYQIIGVELYDSSVKKAKQKKIYQKIIKSDVTNLAKSIPRCDVVLASQLIEHLPKVKGDTFLKKIEKMAFKRVIVSTPVGFMPFHQIEKDEQDRNPLQKHLSGWEVAEFKKRGYKVYGQGIKTIYNSRLSKSLPKQLFPLLNFISFIGAPISYLIPEIAMYMIAVKEIK